MRINKEWVTIETQTHENGVTHTQVRRTVRGFQARTVFVCGGREVVQREPKAATAWQIDKALEVK